jgi:hypothetical protein
MRMKNILDFTYYDFTYYDYYLRYLQYEETADN